MAETFSLNCKYASNELRTVCLWLTLVFVPCSRSAFLAGGFAGDTQDQPECGTDIAQPGTEFCSQAEMSEFCSSCTACGSKFILMIVFSRSFKLCCALVKLCAVI